MATKTKKKQKRETNGTTPAPTTPEEYLVSELTQLKRRFTKLVDNEGLVKVEAARALIQEYAMKGENFEGNVRAVVGWKRAAKVALGVQEPEAAAKGRG